MASRTLLQPGPDRRRTRLQARVDNIMTWYSPADSSFGAGVGPSPTAGWRATCSWAPADIARRTRYINGRTTEQLSYLLGLMNLLP